MSSWRDYAQKADEPAPATCANSVIGANRTPASAGNEAIGTNGTNGTLPAAMAQGLALLATAAAPLLKRADAWPQVVDDAQRLAADGWAAQAVKLGWTALDLFGAMPDPEGDPAGDGLAVRLDGRRILALCEGFATVAEKGDGRSYIHRTDTPGACLLWELGRRQGRG